MSSRSRAAVPAVTWCHALLVVACLGVAPRARAAEPARAALPAGTEVRVERRRPATAKHPTLRFLKDNRDFLRARFERLRAKPVDGRGDAGPMDPRFLAYQRMLAEIRAAQDSAAAAEQARAGHALFASVTELGQLETELDLLGRLLAGQRERLGQLESDFTGLQRTELAVVLTGDARDAPIAALTLTLEDGVTDTIPLPAETRRSLREGGVAQVVRRLVEPREQVVRVGLVGERWPAGDAGYVTLEPTRDRLTFLRLDLTAVQPASGATGIRASTWLHATGLETASGAGTEP